MKTKIKAGDLVAYSVQFLRSIGESPTSDLCHCRGTITDVKHYSDRLAIASIRWDNPEIPEKVNCCNLAIVGPNSKFCAC